MAAVARLANCMAVLRQVPGAYASIQLTALTKRKKSEKLKRDQSIKMGGGEQQDRESL
jgi:hypothetical protein